MRGCITRVRVVGLHGLFPADRAKGKDSDKDTDTRTTPLRTEAFKLTLDRTPGMCKPCAIQEASCRPSWACWLLQSEKKKTSCIHISERSAGLHPSLIDESSTSIGQQTMCHLAPAGLHGHRAMATDRHARKHYTWTATLRNTRHPLPSEPTPTLSVSSVCPAQGWPGPAHPNCFPSLPPIQPAPLPGPVAFGTFCPLPDPRHALALPRALATYVSAPSSSTYSTRYLHVLLPEHPGRCARAASLALAHQRLTFHIHGPSLTRRLPCTSTHIHAHPPKPLVFPSSLHHAPLPPLLAPSALGHPM
ncbi:hypothetical protein COCC4DRAFT_77632 [Bipolaris maydis ATCC 48331]|uniref:Uncharacterized protein n=2 Tax=Cochliobolus heterostrophus TaxID=5016 RepID=M2V839_COCH5|nr:uncharacterized protein COCC4DRAFT_77632 [Bipolaris maydis ATCC 48331]EMD96157.1 hypothetical protein COCHEDRAFT_1201022 [Bipolaris maydis C5]ENI11016.1 hypothetical protein COCC4DRAFT_77632 [Bipolaris maydis ATCC 48331]KAJ6213079.1 hypothetical protein PSV09DRAFT_1201022 [Bipolaris maydis]